MDLPDRIDFGPTLARLERVARDHFTLFRLGVGRLLLDDLFDGDGAAYFDRDRTKPHRFDAFLRQHGAELAELGLGETTLRKCIVCRIVADGLPESVLERLRIKHLTVLAQVPDGATRSVLALASVENGWTSAQLRDAALAARAGRWIDGAPEVPGLQPPTPKPAPAPPAHLGRVVTRYERSATGLGDLAAQWSTVTRKPTGDEKARMQAALAEIVARAQRMLADLD